MTLFLCGLLARVMRPGSLRHAMMSLFDFWSRVLRILSQPRAERFFDPS